MGANEIPNKTIYVVATIQGSPQMFADILLVTEDIQQASIITSNAKERRPYPGLDYNLLAPYSDVMFFKRELGKVICNKEEADECKSKEVNKAGNKDN
jgi:hypothetical protein